MWFTPTRIVACFLALSVAAAFAQPPEFPGAEPEHELLQRFVGEWRTEMKCMAGEGSEMVENEGKIHARMLGDFWIINEMEVASDEAPMHGLQTIGYDAGKQKYVGTWVDTMMNHLWVYEGDYDEASNTFTLYADGPDFLGEGDSTRFRDSYEFVSEDEIVARSAMEAEAGEWQTIMTGVMRRAGSE